MRRIYKSPPVVEALCSFRFIPADPWDWTIPGLLYDKVKKEYPEKRQQGILELELQTSEQGVGISQKALGETVRMQFLREDGSALIQIGPNMLVVNQLRPYPNWPRFRGSIIDVLDEYIGVGHPKAIQTVGLRYINRIELPDRDLALEEWFAAYPRIPDVLPRILTSFFTRTEIVPLGCDARMTLTMGTVGDQAEVKTPQAKSNAAILDLDFTTVREEQVSRTDVEKWLDNAHDQIEQYFEACLTDRTRALFGVME